MTDTVGKNCSHTGGYKMLRGEGVSRRVKQQREKPPRIRPKRICGLTPTRRSVGCESLWKSNQFPQGPQPPDLLSCKSSRFLRPLVPLLTSPSFFQRIVDDNFPGFHQHEQVGRNVSPWVRSIIRGTTPVSLPTPPHGWVHPEHQFLVSTTIRLSVTPYRLPLGRSQ